MDATAGLTHLNGTVLDVSSGVTATSAISFLAGRGALVGTSAGSLLLCMEVENGSLELQPQSEVTLHCGAVHDIALSADQLVATAGHDAVSCVFPLSKIFQKNGGLSQCVRITGHSVPVVAVKFFSSGAKLVTLGVDGRVLLVDVQAAAVVASVECSFASACLALSPEETILYVGGRSLAAVDLCYATRPTSVQLAFAAAQPSLPHGRLAHANTDTSSARVATLRTPPGMRLMEWEARSTGPHDPSAQDRVPHGLYICAVDTSAADGAVVALFARRTPLSGSVEPCGSARWAPGGGRMASETAWINGSTANATARLPSRSTARKPSSSPSGLVRVRCRVKSAPRAGVKGLTMPARSSSTTAAALWGGRWCAAPFELAESVPVLVLPEVVAASSDATTRWGGQAAFPMVGPATPAEALAAAEAERDALQRECDELVFQVRSILSAKRPDRTS